MALVEITQNIVKVGVDPHLQLSAVDGADVFIELSDGDPVDLFADMAGAVPLASPVVSDNGRVTAWTEEGQHLRFKALLPGALDPDPAWEYFYTSGPPGPAGPPGPDTEAAIEPLAVKPAVAVAVLYVDSVAGSNADDGLSWGTAKQTIAAAITAMPAGGGRINLAAGVHTPAATLAVPTKVILRGQGEEVTEIRHAFNGDMATLGTAAGFEHLWINGQGGSFTGRGIVLTGTTAQQKCRHMKCINFANHCLAFGYQAGSQSSFIDCTFYQLTDGAGNHAVHIEDVQQLAAMPRKFVACESGGYRFIHLGGCPGVSIHGGYIGEIEFTDSGGVTSRGCTIYGSRLGGAHTTWTIKGSNHAIVGNNVGMNVLNQSSYLLYNNTDNGTFTESTAFIASNLVSHRRAAYTPVFTSGGAAPAIGNGVLSGAVSRAGVQVSVEIDLLFGSTTNLGTGDLRVSLPYVAQSLGRKLLTVEVVDASVNTYYVGVAEIIPNDTWAGLRLHGQAGPVTGDMVAPFTFAVGDSIRVSGCYSL
jgi:hypothetical protein